MSSQAEKLSFSNRLKQALNDAGYPVGPTLLAKEFNIRYNGTEVSIQSANNWLHGKAIPSQDKLSVLAIWLNVSVQWLRFGDSPTFNQNENSDSSIESDYYIKYKSLSLAQKKIIKMLIDEFSKK